MIRVHQVKSWVLGPGRLGKVEDFQVAVALALNFELVYAGLMGMLEKSIVGRVRQDRKMMLYFGDVQMTNLAEA